jgi:Lauroyl/myristoyl acyltransferase
LVGPKFRSKIISKKNLSKAFPTINEDEKDNILKSMWTNYGKIFAEYAFIKNFRISKLNKLITIENENFLEEIKANKKPVIFVSGHFNNFELMAMSIEKYGIDLAAIYRPLKYKFFKSIDGKK